MTKPSTTIRAALLVLAFVLVGGAGAFVGYLLVDRETAPEDRTGVAEPGFKVEVSMCGVEEPLSEPSEIMLACGDGNAVAKSIEWQSWGPAVAVGAAMGSTNDCEPTCAEGSFYETPVTIVLDQVLVNGVGPQFTRATVLYPPGDARRDPELLVLDYDLPVFSK